MLIYYITFNYFNRLIFTIYSCLLKFYNVIMDLIKFAFKLLINIIIIILNS